MSKLLMVHEGNGKALGGALNRNLVLGLHRSAAKVTLELQLQNVSEVIHKV